MGKTQLVVREHYRIQDEKERREALRRMLDGYCRRGPEQEPDTPPHNRKSSRR